MVRPPIGEAGLGTHSNDIEDRLRKVVRRRRPADLIIDDAKRRLRSCKPKDRLDEVLPVRRKDPARSQDDVRSEAFAHRGLAAQLAPAVDAEWSWRIVLAGGPRGVAIEYVIGGEMNERDGGLGARGGDILGTYGVDAMSDFRFGFPPGRPQCRPRS